jgi:enamine deaminase RidA (YjgF/YER057c/UK114 family)
MTSQTRLTHIAAPEGVAPGAGYTHVVTGSGRLIAVSGQVALDFENLRRCLAAARGHFQ